MVTSRQFSLLLLLLLGTAGAHAREAATAAECEAAATQAPIVEARSAAAAAPGELRAQYRLADAWSEAGCFSNALQVLSEAARLHPGDRELQTRLRVARSVVGEERFFDNLDRAEDQARTKRNAFRCSSLQDVAACADLVRASPDDAQAFASQGDALLKAGRAADALESYRRARGLSPDLPLADKITAAEALVDRSPAESGEPPPAAPRPRPSVRVARADSEPARYSNQEPESRSH